MTPNSQPDWRDARAYTYTETHDGALWAWEFLRRDPEYRADWEGVLGSYLESGRELYAPLDSGNFVIDLPQEFREQARQRWGLHGYLNPDVACPRWDILSFETDRAGSREPLPGVWCSSGDHTFHLEGTTVLVAVDLRQPLVRQQRWFEDDIRDLQQRLLKDGKAARSRLRPDMWQTYLRVADAHAAGATPQEIAAVLFPELKNEWLDYQGSWRVRDYLKKARQLIGGGYRDIANATKFDDALSRARQFRREGADLASGTEEK